MSFFPPPIIAAAIASALIIPALLILLSWGPTCCRHAGRRYKISVVIGWLCWPAIVLATSSGAPSHFLDWAAGASIMAGMTLASFIAWSLPAYGITFNMVIALAQSKRPLDLNAWASQYSGGRSIHQICVDRLQHLFLFRLAKQQGDTITLTAKPARIFGAIMITLYFIFGMSRPR